MEIKIKERTVKFKRLTKSLIKEIESQICRVEDEYGAMSANFLQDDILTYGAMEIRTNNIKYYIPFVSVWDLIKESDDVALVELKNLKITDEEIAYEYAMEIWEYIRYWILNNELNVLCCFV